MSYNLTTITEMLQRTDQIPGEELWSQSGSQEESPVLAALSPSDSNGEFLELPTHLAGCPWCVVMLWVFYLRW